MNASELAAFVAQYSGFTESYWFYDHSVQLCLDTKEHIYYKVMPTGELAAQNGVTNVSGILDKSNALVPWACKMMAQEILDNSVKYHCAAQGDPSGDYIIPRAEFESLILAAKSAHKKKLDHASFVGNQAHDWLEKYIRNEIAGGWKIDLLPRDAQAANCCRAALDWMNQHNIRWIHTEKKVYSLGYEFAGTMDGLCIADSCTNRQCCRSEFKDKTCLADWKSSNALREEYLLQTAAYQYAYQEEHGTPIYGRWVIRLGKEDGEFEPWFVDDMEEDWLAFRHALGLKKAIDKIEQRMKDHETVLKAERKEEKKQAREAALTIKCKGADKYKGKRKPTCNGGNPCESCTNKYNKNHTNIHSTGDIG